MSNNRKFQGVWIPADLWLDRALSLTEKVMLVEISSLEHEERGCYATNAHFAEFFGLSNSRVSEIINGLAAKGFLVVDLIREGRQIVERQIWIANPFGKPKTPSENTATPFGKRCDPPSENTKGNNTKSNNTNEVKHLGETVDVAFEGFWKVSHKNGSKKKARELFAAIIKREKLDPMMFAVELTNDTMARQKGQQFGFDKLHITTYLTQERWKDDVKAADAKPASSTINHDFGANDYQNTADADLADWMRGDDE